MKLNATIGGKTREIEPAAGDLVEVEPGIYSALIDGRAYELAVDEAEAGAFTIAHRSGQLEITIEDPRRLARDRSGRGASGSQTLSAPMPGKVVEALVAEGDTVTEGQGVLVIEAMKMQNEVKAPRDGVVVRLEVAAGDSVSPGQSLAIIE